MSCLRTSVLCFVVSCGCAMTRERVELDRLDAVIAEAQAKRVPLKSAAARKASPSSLALNPGAPMLAVYETSGDGARAAGAGDPSAAGPSVQSDGGVSPSANAMTPLPGLWDTIARDVRRLPEDLWQDTKKVYGRPENLVILGLSYGGALAIQGSGVDDTVENGLRGHDVFTDDWNIAFGALGNPATHFALAGAWYLVGQQSQNEKTYRVGKKLFSALIINGLSTMAGQVASWDDAPNGEWGTFPSGHTSSTFAVASVLHEEYGPLVGVPLYGLGALVAIERLDDDEHYFSDVVFGGVMGLVIGHSVARDEPIRLWGGQIMPYTEPYNGSSGIAWVKHWK